MAAGVKGVAALQHELEKAKENLKDVDENIKKLTGREPGLNRSGQGRAGPGGRPGIVRRVVHGDRDNFGGREHRPFGVFRRGLEDAGIPPAKRQATRGAFSRLGPRVIQSRLQPRRGPDSGDEEELPSRPAVQSSVVATPKDTASRKEALDQQNKDEKGKARNRRMFGALLGTLQSFKKEEIQKDVKVKQRKAIEEKLEEKAKEEKEGLKRERQTLFSERRAQQQKLRRLEQKMELVDIHEEWESQTKKLMNFIRTKAKPPLFYNPKRHNSKTEAKLKDSRSVLEDIITERRKQLEEEIEELTQHDDADGAAGQDEEKAEGEGKARGDEEDVDMDTPRDEEEAQVDPVEQGEDSNQPEEPAKDQELQAEKAEPDTDKKDRDSRRHRSSSSNSVTREGDLERDSKAEPDTDKKDRESRRHQSSSSSVTREGDQEKDSTRDKEKEGGKDKEKETDREREKDRDKEMGREKDKHRSRGRDSDKDRDKDRGKGKDRDESRHEHRHSDRDRRHRKDSERDEKGRSSRRHGRDSRGEGDKKDKDKRKDGEGKENVRETDLDKNKETEGGKDAGAKQESDGVKQETDIEMADETSKVDQPDTLVKKEIKRRQSEDGEEAMEQSIKGEGGEKNRQDKLKEEISQGEGKEESPVTTGEATRAVVSMEY